MWEAGKGGTVQYERENGHVASAPSAHAGFLRSINLCYDATHPERIAHYQPTTKSATILRALAGLDDDRAFVVVAPYGSGKSIAATYLLHLVENRRDSSLVLWSLAAKLKDVDPALGHFAFTRRRKPRHFGFVLALHGSCRSLAQSLKTATLGAMARHKLGRQARTIQAMPCDDMAQAIGLLSEVRQKAREVGCDRLVILWDEFGRHLESLLAEGRPTALSDIQLLAEFVSRSSELPMTLGVLLHQGLLSYAGNVPQSLRAEWTKIEGRFCTIDYIDDSKELYRLIGDVVASRVTVPPPPPSTVASTGTACQQLGLFPQFTQSELTALLLRAYPLMPATLYLLPRLASRVAQNERTLFSFLHSMPLTGPVGPALLYDYFAPVMRADTTIGGTYRQWLETQSALDKVGDDVRATEALKIACLLGLGTKGERSRASRALLLLALNGYDASDGTEQALDSLIERKLLLHRRYNDEVSVWHGTDVDLRGKLEMEKVQQREQFQLHTFLANEVPPPVWRPTEYNDHFALRRYLSGAYCSLARLSDALSDVGAQHGIPMSGDGTILYVMAETPEELSALERIVHAPQPPASTSGCVVFALLREPLPLGEAALEVACLLQMQRDTELVGTDPLVLPELQHMTDDARVYLQRLLDRLIYPSPQGPRWFHNGREFTAASPRDLRRALSAMMHQVYPLTPKIANEMIVRQKPTPVIVNARRKLLLSILERSGAAHLGIAGSTPTASMYRTVLLHTGLYRQANSETHWEYTLPEHLADPGLQGVWRAWQEFLTVPAEAPKAFCGLFDTLMAPPFGVRAGLLPILFAAALQAFPSARALLKHGEYVTDILPSEIEQVCRDPQMYRLIVLDLQDVQWAYLRAFHQLFHPETTQTVPENDLIRQCFDALESWKVQLPSAAMTTTSLSDVARRFRAALHQQANPVALLFDAIPAACGYSVQHLDLLLTALRHCQAELTGVASVYSGHAAAAVRRVLTFGRQQVAPDVRAAAWHWGQCFSQEVTDHLPDAIAKGFVARVRMPYDTDAALLNALSTLLVGKPLHRWDDSTAMVFDRELQHVVRRVEDAALLRTDSLSQHPTAAQGLAELIRSRMADLFAHLTTLVSVHEAEEMLDALRSSVLMTHAEKD